MWAVVTQRAIFLSKGSCMFCNEDLLWLGADSNTVLAHSSSPYVAHTPAVNSQNL